MRSNNNHAIYIALGSNVVDLAARDDLAVVAMGDAGTSIVTLNSSGNPALAAQFVIDGLKQSFPHVLA